jgi:uncharacterized protein YgiB involved in biofilm formation
MNKKRKSSAHMTLVLIGATALSGCGENTQRRDLYSDRADCVRDWGDDDKKCQPSTRFSGGSSTGSIWYYGPSYNNGEFGSNKRSYGDGMITEARTGSRAMGTAHVTRGGFGSTGSTHSGGG